MGAVGGGSGLDSVRNLVECCEGGVLDRVRNVVGCYGITIEGNLFFFFFSCISCT